MQFSKPTTTTCACGVRGMITTSDGFIVRGTLTSFDPKESAETNHMYVSWWDDDEHRSRWMCIETGKVNP